MYNNKQIYNKDSKCAFTADLKVSMFGISGNKLGGREFHCLAVLGM